MKTYNKLPLPTIVQARLIAAHWASGECLKHSAYDTPTQSACLRKGWFEISGETGNYPNGSTWTGYKVTRLGCVALENFLMHQRLAEVTAQ